MLWLRAASPRGGGTEGVPRGYRVVHRMRAAGPLPNALADVGLPNRRLAGVLAQRLHQISHLANVIVHVTSAY